MILNLQLLELFENPKQRSKLLSNNNVSCKQEIHSMPLKKLLNYAHKSELSEYKMILIMWEKNCQTSDLLILDELQETFVCN